MEVNLRLMESMEAVFASSQARVVVAFDVSPCVAPVLILVQGYQREGRSWSILEQGWGLVSER